MTIEEPFPELFPNRELPLSGAAVMENFLELEYNLNLFMENGTISLDEDVITGDTNATIVLYTIGDVENDTPLGFTVPAVLAGTVKAVKFDGPAALSGCSVDFKVNGVTQVTTAEGDGWTSCNETIAAGDVLKFAVNTLSGGTGSGLCYLRVKN